MFPQYLNFFIIPNILSSDRKVVEIKENMTFRTCNIFGALSKGFAIMAASIGFVCRSATAAAICCCKKLLVPVAPAAAASAAAAAAAAAFCEAACAAVLLFVAAGLLYEPDLA